MIKVTLTINNSAQLFTKHFNSALNTLLLNTLILNTLILHNSAQLFTKHHPCKGKSKV